MNILFLTKYERQGASSRYRTFQYLPFFANDNIRISISSLFCNGYLLHLYKYGRLPLMLLLYGIIKRLLVCCKLKMYDLVVIEKELFPYVPYCVEQILLSAASGYTLDMDDALFHKYDLSKKQCIRLLLGDKYKRLMAKARLVTAGNKYIFEYAAKCTKSVERLPTVVDDSRYQCIPEPKGVFTVAWIGTPKTQKYLNIVSVALKRFFECRSGRLLVIGSDMSLRLERIPLEIVPWSETSEITLLQRCHVGIMPLPDMPIERGKSGLKLLQYMACGRPVIASPIGVNREIVSAGTGFLAENDDEWFSYLVLLSDNPELRMAMGANGRRQIEKRYSLSKWAPRYARMIRSAVGMTDRAGMERAN